MPVKIKSIVSYKQNNPTASLADIGARFKVSKQYIYKVLKKQNISTSINSSFDPRRTIKRHVRYCLVCGNISTRLLGTDLNLRSREGIKKSIVVGNVTIEAEETV